MLFCSIIVGIEGDSYPPLQDKEENKKVLYQHGQAQYKVFLIESQDKNFNNVGVHTFADGSSIAALAIKPPCEHTIDGGEEGNPLIAEILKEGLEDGIDISKHGYLGEFLEFGLNDKLA